MTDPHPKDQAQLIPTRTNWPEECFHRGRHAAIDTPIKRVME